MHFAKSSDSEIFEFLDNSEFSISHEKVISRQHWSPGSDRLIHSFCAAKVTYNDFKLLLMILMYCYCSWYCTDQIFLKNFTERSNVINFLSVTNFKIGTYITPENISRLPETV